MKVYSNGSQFSTKRVWTRTLIEGADNGTKIQEAQFGRTKANKGANSDANEGADKGVHKGGDDGSTIYRGALTTNR